MGGEKGRVANKREREKGGEGNALKKTRLMKLK